MAQSVDSDRLSSAGISTHSSGTAGTVGGSVVGVRVGEQALKREEDEYNLGPLPPMWEKAFTASGEVYFIDHNTGTSHWLDPRLARVRKHSLGECGEDELPFGWERVTDERYGSYYVDHINRRTQYENPVLQARRLRAEKLASENGGSTTPNGQPPTGELRGERFTLTLTKGAQGLGFTLIGAEGVPEMEGYLQIRSIVPHSPAWMDGGLQPGDVLVGVGARGVRGMAHAQVATMFQSIPPGDPVTLHIVRGYPLSFDSADPNTRVLSTLAVESSSCAPAPLAMQHLTTALRTRFNLDSPNPEQLSRDETDTPNHNPQVRCPSADQLISNTDPTNDTLASSEPGRELVLSLRRGAAGFGFTIADSVHGQKVKKVLDRSRCAGLREGDLLLQIGEVDVRHAPHQRVVQALKDCPALHETTLRVWRRNNLNTRAPRSRSATRVPPTSTACNNLSRSKTPTAEQLRNPSLHTQDDFHTSISNGMNSVEATYAVPEHKRERESLIDRRRRSSTPGGRLTLPAQPAQQWDGEWARGQPWPSGTNAGGQRWPDGANTGAQQWADGADGGTEQWTNGANPQSQMLMNERQQWPNAANSGPQQWPNAANGGQQQWPNAANGGQQQWPNVANGGQQQWTNGTNGDWHKWNEQNGNHWDGNDGRWTENWGEVPTPTVHVDMNAAYWRGNASVADSSDNGFPEDGLLHSPTGGPMGALSNQNNRMRGHSPSNSTDRLRSNSPSNTSATDRLLAASPSRLRSPSPSNNSSNGPNKGSPLRMRETSPPGHIHSPVSHRPPSCYDADARAQGSASYDRHTYPHVEAAGSADPAADVIVRLARGPAGFGFRIVGGTEDGSRVAVGYVVAGGPADGLLRPGDLLTSVEGVSLAGASHAAAVAAVSRAAAAGRVALGVRHRRHPASVEPAAHLPHTYNILHPAPMYPQPTTGPVYGVEYNSGWAPDAYDVTLTRSDGEGFGFVVISSTNKATSTIGQLIPNSPAATCGLLHVGDTIVGINHVPIRNLAHPEVVALIKRSGANVVLTVRPTHHL